MSRTITKPRQSHSSHLFNSATTECSSISGTTSTSTGDEVTIQLIPTPHAELNKREAQIINTAVYNHLRFLRSTGRTHISGSDVARALGLPLSLVQNIALKHGAKLED